MLDNMTQVFGLVVRYLPMRTAVYAEAIAKMNNSSKPIQPLSSRAAGSASTPVENQKGRKQTEHCQYIPAPKTGMKTSTRHLDGYGKAFSSCSFFLSQNHRPHTSGNDPKNPSAQSKAEYTTLGVKNNTLSTRGMLKR